MSAMIVTGQSGGACICGADEECTVGCFRHNRVLHGYPCIECQQEWKAKFPRTHAAIGKFASGKGSKAGIDRARKLDLADQEK